MKVGLALFLALCPSGCALARLAETPAGQPVFVLSQPACLIVCAADFGTVRGEYSSGLSLSQTSGAGAVRPGKGG